MATYAGMGGYGNCVGRQK